MKNIKQQIEEGSGALNERFPFTRELHSIDDRTPPAGPVTLIAINAETDEICIAEYQSKRGWSLWNHPYYFDVTHWAYVPGLSYGVVKDPA